MILLDHILGGRSRKIEETDPGFIGAATDGGNELHLRVFNKNISHFPKELFRISLVNTPHQGESQVTALRFTGQDTQTCGYVFPIHSLRTGEYLPDGKWPAIYAAAATRELVETEIALQLITDRVSSEPYIEITELFPDNIGVLVLGYQQIEQADTSIEAVELMLMEYGFMPRSTGVVSNKPLGGRHEYRNRVPLRKVASQLADDIDALKWLLASTSVQKTNIGRFLTLYQIIEHLISLVFGSTMTHLIDDRRSRMDPWWLREMVQKIHKEKWRLKFIRQGCLSSGMTETFNDNTSSCEELLVRLNLRQRNDGSSRLDWAEALYRVRNVMVHRQVLLRQVDDELIGDVCDTLQQVCFEIVEKYINPSPDFLQSNAP